MASDIKDLTRFYANLPSIFETDPSISVKSSSNVTTKIIDSEKPYQPIFGSFLFTNSEPFTKAAFVTSTFLSNDTTTDQGEQINDNNSVEIENPISNSSNIQLTLQEKSSTPMEDLSDMDDEDDFDGISIRHGSIPLKKTIDNDNNLMHNHFEKNNLFDRLVHSIEHNYEDTNNNYREQDDDDDDIELFLNGFTDQQHNDTITMPKLFDHIPDIDDPNQVVDDDEDYNDNNNNTNNNMLFSPIDMYDQSDSMRSPSPDSLLSSSNLLEDDDDVVDDDDDEEVEINKNDDDDDDDDVTQWNDDFILRKSTSQNDRPNAPLPPLIPINLGLHEQVDFIDSSNSNSRCSNDSLHLSMGYNDQARIFIEDDDVHEGLSTSSESNNDDDEIHFENDTFDRENTKDISLQINLDYHRSRSSSESSYHLTNHEHSSSTIPDESPIIDIDEDIHVIKPLQPAPLALVVNVDADADVDDNDLEIFTSNQPVLSTIPLENLFQLREEIRENEIIHDIINMRHMLDEHDNDDDFLAVMHNPSVFEEVLCDNDDQQPYNLVKQTNMTTSSMSNESSQPCIDNKIERKVIKSYNNIQQSSSLSISTSKENDASNIKITNNPFTSTTVNHLLIEREEEKENIDGIKCSSVIQKKDQKLDEATCSSINIIHITNKKDITSKCHRMMSSDDESDNDPELLNTLAQLHGLVITPRLSSERNQNEHVPDILHKHNQQYDEDKINNLYHSENQKKNYSKKEEQISSTCFSLTSLTSSGLFNDDESHSADIILDSDGSSSFITSMNELNNPLLSSSNQLIINDSQIMNTNINIDDDLQQTKITANYNLNSDDLQNRRNDDESSYNVNIDKNDLIKYLDWIISHLYDNSQSSNTFNTIGHSHPNMEQSDISQIEEDKENNMLSFVDRNTIRIVEELVSDMVQLVSNDINSMNEQVEHLVDQILSQAIYEVYIEDSNLPIENLSSIINDHVQRHEQILDSTKQFQLSHNIIDDQHTIDSESFYSNILDESNLFSMVSNQESCIQESISSSLLLSSNLFDSTITSKDLLTECTLITFAKHTSLDDSCSLQKNQSSINTDDKIHEESIENSNLKSTENQLAPGASVSTARKLDPSTSSDSDDDDDDNDDDDNDNQPLKQGSNVFTTTSRTSQFEAFASDRPLNTGDIKSMAHETNTPHDESSSIENSTTPFEQESDATNAGQNVEEPWELEDSGEEVVKPSDNIIQRKFDSYDNVPLDSPISTLTRKIEPKFTTAANEENDDESESESETENYDNYFSQSKPTEKTEAPPTKTVRFDENIEQVTVLTPKDSLDESIAESSTSDSDSNNNDDDDDEDDNKNKNDDGGGGGGGGDEIPSSFQQENDRITDFMNEKENNDKKTTESTTFAITRPSTSQISLTESEDLPPPLPSLPPLNKKSTVSNDNIPVKSSLTSSPKVNIDSKTKSHHSRSDPEISSHTPKTTDDNLLSNTNAAVIRSFDSVS